MGKRSWISFLGAAAFAILLLAAATPFVLFALIFVMVPVILITARVELKQVPLYVLPALILAYFLSGSMGSSILLVALFFLPAALAMGVLYRKQATARSVVTAGAVTILGVMLVWLLALNALGYNLIAEFRKVMSNYYAEAQRLMQGVVSGANEQVYLDLTISILPVMFILFAIALAFIGHGLSRWLLSKTGMQVSRLKPLREWMMPKGFVFMYVLVLIANMFIPFNSTSVVSMLVVNLYPLLLLAFSLQAISFLFYISHVKGWSRLLPILSIVAVVLYFPVIFIFSFLGLMDAAFPIREMLSKKN